MVARRAHYAAVTVITILFSFALADFIYAEEKQQAEEKPQPVTTDNHYVPVEELKLYLPALSKEELLAEAEGWQKILRNKAIEIGKLEIAVKRQNREIAKAEDIQAQARKAADQLDKLEDQADTAEKTGESAALQKTEKATEQAQETVSDIATMVEEAADAAEETAEIRDVIKVKNSEGLEQTVEAAEKAEESLDKVQQVVDEANLEDSGSIREAAEDAKEATREARQATAVVEENISQALQAVDQSVEHTQVMQETRAVMTELEESKKEEKKGLLETLVSLREQRTIIIDNLNAVLEELALKTDPKDSATLAKLNDYRLYVRAVQGMHLDVTDTTSSWMAVKGWLTSVEGGLRVALNFARFIGVLIAAWFLAIICSRMLGRALNMIQNVSLLLKDFLVSFTRWTIMCIGVIMALSALEISVTPLLAMVGAAGFIIALAMQDSLSNFASGIMILFFRPFDVGDFIDAGGVSGKVSSVNLVSTTIRTADNKKMFVPNNKIWRDVIINATGVRTRRVDMEFKVGYQSDMEKVQQILEDIVSQHPMVLKSPEPVIRMHILADSSVNFVCRPWVKAADYWDVYWDVTKAAKEKFDAKDINIPYPQQDLHLYVEQDLKNPESLA